MKFNQYLWEKTEPIYKKIINHPFNVELKEGTLDIEKFRFYIHQDSIYLSDFAKALAIAASRAPKSEMVKDILSFASDSITVESLLHEKYFSIYDIKHTGIQSPACFMYTNYLLKVCSLCSFEEAIASLLPCFWIYREVGVEISKNTGKNNRYIDWINTYSGEEFNLAVEKMLSIINEIADNSSQQLKEKMLEKYTFSIKMEYMFWDSAYKKEEWCI